MRRAIPPLAALLAAGCGPPDGYDVVRAACGLAPGDHVAIPAGVDRAYRPLTEGCADALGGALGVEWEGFGEAPHAIEAPESPAERLLAGAYALLAADVGDAATLFDPDASPAVVRGELAGAPVRADDPDDAAAWWWSWLVDSVVVVRYDPDPDDTYSMRYVLGRIEVSPLLAGSSAYQAATPVEAAAILVHEATHRAAPPHLPCPDTGARSCDGTADSAYGAEALWLDAWLRANADAVDADDAARTRDTLAAVCTHILDTAGFAPCAGTDSLP